MAALLAALGFGSAKENKVEEPPGERKSLAMVLAETGTQTTRYMEKVASDIVGASPVFGKARVPIVAGHRDKESVMCEIIDLKKVLEETESHLHMHKQYYLRLLEESRNLEREVEELELRGNFDAPRTGGVVRLESRFKEKSLAKKSAPYTSTVAIEWKATKKLIGKGLGAQLSLMEDLVAERKYGELAQLRKDLGGSHTRETEVERDTVAAEILRLKILLNHMELLYKEAKENNEDLKLCNRRLPRLETANPKVRNQIEATKAMIKISREEIEQLKKAGEEAQKRMQELAKQETVFEAKMKELAPKAQAARVEKKKLTSKNNQIGYDRMIFNQEFRKAHPGVLLL